MNIPQSVLFVDDELEVRRANAQTLELAGFHVQTYESAEHALMSLGEGIHAIVSDLKMTGMDGISFLRHIRQFDADLPVILITAHGDVATAVEAMKVGAYDFVQKPYPADRLVESVRRACEKRRLVLDNRRLRSQLKGPALESKLLGSSRAIADVRRAISELGPTIANVIIRGETGAGKEVVARCLHALGSRLGGPFVAINCGAIPDAIFESELFGHDAGAFTGATSRRIGKLEHASGGTVLLDEIESMPLAAQVKLLRVIQERSIERLGSNRIIPIDVRLIAATQIDLLEASGKGSFRSDLYYRLAVAEICVPPLRDRRDDIPLLFEFFISEAAKAYGRPSRTVDTQDYLALMTHAWPGNVRELKNVAERFVLAASEANVSLFMNLPRIPVAPIEGNDLPLHRQIEEVERRLIVMALKKSDGDIRTAMNLLKVPRRTLNEKMLKYEIDRHDFFAAVSPSKTSTI